MQSITGLFTLVIGGLVAYGIGVISYRLWFHPLSKVPGPKLLAVTELPYLYQEHVQGAWARHVAGLHRQYGPIVRIAPNRLALDGSIAWPQVYAHRKGKAEFSKIKGFFFPGDEASMIQSNSDDHRRQRRQLAHAFSEAAMYEQEPIIAQHISKLIQKLDLFAKKGESVDITRWLSFITFDIIGDLTFTDSFHCLDDSKYHSWVLTIFPSMRGQALRRFMNALPLLRPLFSLFISTREIENSDEHRKLGIAKAETRMAQGELPNKRWDFMTYMMRANQDGEKGMHEHEIHANLSLLITAGSETTATALSGFFYYLGRNPKVYNVLADEIRGAFKSEDDVSIRTTAPLQYLDAVIEETLRVYPPAGETPPRVSPGDVVGGYYVPKGTQVSTCQWATFRNPNNFIDPNSFCPERWLPASHPRYERRFDGDNRDAFRPFSHGPRDCIGKNLAYAEMRVIIARVLYHFDFVLDGSYDKWQDSQAIYLVWGKGPLIVRLTPRASQI